jgi:hypothetical protein
MPKAASSQLSPAQLSPLSGEVYARLEALLRQEKSPENLPLKLN